MALRDEITADYQKIALEVRVAGRKVSDVIGVDCSSGFDQANAQATLICRSRPSWAEEGAQVEVWAGYNGQTTQIFGGECSGHAWRFFPGTIGMDCRDKLARLRYKWKGVDREYTEEDDAAIIRNLLEAYGIPSSEANIESSSWTLGVIEPVLLKAGDDAWSLIQQIDQLAGYRTYTTPQGTIIRRRVSGSPSAGAAWHFVRGVDIHTGAQRTRNLDGIINHAIVRGLTYEDVEVFGEASAANAYVPDPPAEVADEVQSNLVETDEKAEEIAQRIVGDFNRRPERLELPVIGNPLIIPGMTVQVTHSDLEAEGALVFVEHIDHHISGATFTSTVRTTGGNLSGYNASAPIAAISVTFFLEGEDTGSGIAQRIIAIVDGSASFDPDGTTLTYVWTITPDAGTATPSSGSTQVLRVVLTGAVTESVIGLTVTDIDGLTGTASATYPIDTSTMLVEDLYSAEGTLMACSSDGQQTWQEQTVPDSATATCLSEIAPVYQVWGADSGHIYASFDKLRTAPLDFSAPHGAVACTAVWIHETDPTRLWAGFADGQVWFGLVDTDAKTCAWTLAGTVPASPINELRESYGTFGELRATAGEAEYYSADAGATWTIGLAGAEGSTAWRMAAGFDTNAVAYLTDTTPVRYEGGSTPTFPALDPAVEAIRGISFGYRVKELYAADDQHPARLFRSDEMFATFAEVGSSAGLSQINHVIRSGNEDGIVYMAGGDGDASDGGIIKAIRMGAPWYARRTGTRQVYQVGYGGSHLPERVVTVEMLMPTWAASPGGMWHYTTAAGWVLKNSGLPTGWRWRSIAADAYDPDHWMLLGGADGTLACGVVDGVVLAGGTSSSPLWRTTDAGATWTPVTLETITSPATIHGPVAVVFDPATAGAWWLAGHCLNNPYNGGTRSTMAAWRGLNGSTVSHLNDITWNECEGVAAGVGGDVIVSGADTPTGNTNKGKFGYAAPGDTVFTAAGVNTSLVRTVARLPGALPSVVGICQSATDTGTLWAATDYRVSTLVKVVDDNLGNGPICAATTGVYIGGRANGIAKVTDPLGSPSVTSVTETVGAGIGAIAADNQTRVAVAARIASNIDNFVFDGETWVQIAGPAGWSASDLADCIMPLSRST
jgi:hypothetical protein